MQKDEELDSSGFLLINKGLGNKLPSTKHESTTKHSELKLWICDIFTLRKCIQENQIECYNFRGLPVNIVNVFGVITDVTTNRFGVLYKVDDGTGIIGCRHAYTKIMQKEALEKRLDSVMSGVLEKHTNSDDINTSVFSEPSNSVAPQGTNLTQAAQWLESQIRECTKTKKDTLFVVGDTVHLRGRPTDFRGERCIRISNIQLVNNIYEEADRRFELVQLYESFYSKQGL